jgi:uncharacterized protein (DUF1800 family)
MTNPRFEAALGLHRFGFGPVAGSTAAIADDPRGALLADLERPGAGRVAAANLPNSGQAARALFEFRAERLAKEKLAQRAKKEAEAKGIVVGAADGDAMNPTGDAQAPKPEAAQTQQNQQPPLPAQLVQNEAKVRIEAAVAAEIGFVEHLVWFWSNHFCVSANKIVSMAGAYEREAIRPHVLGRFVDMLTAVESHPAMLFYLDNVQSMGPNSVAGINRDKSLNENLAREILELHTLGVRTGYSQNDVTRFANVSPIAAGSSFSSSAYTSRANRPCSARPIPTPGWVRAVRCSQIWRGIRRLRHISHTSSRGISWPTSLRSRWSTS